MRLSGAPSLPVPLPVPSAQLASNNPGVSDFHPACRVPRGRQSPFRFSPSIADHATDLLAALFPVPLRLPFSPAPVYDLNLAVTPSTYISPSDCLPS